MVAVIDALNREVARRVDQDRLAAADAVLRAALYDSTRQRVGWLPRPGPG